MTIDRRPTIRKALAAAATLLATTISCGRFSEPQPAQLIASAFRAQRNLEVRLPGVPHAPILSSRGEGSGPVATPELAEAEAILLRQIRTASPPPALIALQSRVLLLRNQWDAALDAAREAYEADAARGGVDLGVAYLARGIALRRPRDLQMAIEHLSEALVRSPNDPVVLFNRAIAFEKFFLFRRAAGDCRAYLQVDASGGWAEEVRERLLRIQQKLDAWHSKLEWFTGSEDVYLNNHASAPAEIFLDAAITEWLPRLVDPDSVRSSKARQALTVLAQRLSERHQDSWLSDLLSNPGPPAAVRALAAAVEANGAARRDAGLKYAGEARRLFESRSNFAGAARARMEEVYALSRSFRPRECLDEAASLTPLLRGRRFPWLEGQLRMEQSVCALHNGDFEAALKGMERSLQQIQLSGYETLYLRGIGLQATLHRLLGDTGTAARESWRGLELFWKGIHPLNRAFQFYSELYLAAEREQRWVSAHAFAQEGVDTIALGPNRMTEAVARSRLGAFALQIGQNAEALQQAELTAALLQPFRAMTSAREYRLQSLLVAASAYLATGRTGEAAKALDALRSEEEGGSILTRLALHRTYGLVHDRKQEWKQARQELLAAAGIAQTAIGSLSDDAGRLRWKRETDPVFRSLTRIALDYEYSPETAMGLWEWFRSAPVRRQLVPFAETLQSRLRLYATASVISWAQIDDRLAIWFLDNQGVRFAWSPAPASRVKALGARFSRLCSRPDSDLAALRTIGQELYQALVAPIASYLNPSRVLLVEPDIVPGAIAFEALVHPDGRWLGEHFTIITSPGVWAELALRERPSSIRPSASALIIGNPSYTPTAGEFFGPLPHAEREAQFVGRLLPSGQMLLGAAATARAITTSLPQAEVFHFAGHARFDGESARLLLAGEGAVLDARAIEKSAGRCRLAVLSACSTAAERDGPWSVESLVQAFWRAGTPEVIASRWEVDSSVTARLFVEFYTHRLRGASGAESLRRAAATVRSLPGSAHPFFWAPFHVFGCVPMQFEVLP